MFLWGGHHALAEGKVLESLNPQAAELTCTRVEDGRV